MYANVDTFTMAVQWCCVLLLGLLAYISWSAWQTEIEQGLRQSKNRFRVCVGLFCAAVCFVLLSTVLSLTGGSGTPKSETTGTEQPVPPPEETPEIRQKRQQLDELETRLSELSDQRAELLMTRRELRTEIFGSDVDDGFETEADPGINVGSFTSTFVIFAVVSGIALLFLLGDARTVLALFQPGRRSEQRLRAVMLLDRIAAETDAGRHLDALTLAEELRIPLLEQADQLDWLYLKSYCNVYLASVETDEDTKTQADPNSRAERLEEAVKDLRSLLDTAPEHHEGNFLLGVALSQLKENAEALECFDQTVAPLINEKLPMAHNRSVCMMNLAEEALGRGEVEKANAFFDKVVLLREMADQVPGSWVKVRFRNIRQKLSDGDLDAAKAELDKVQKTDGLNDDQHKAVALICDAFRTLVPARAGNDEEAERMISDFVRRYVPEDFWNPGDDIADEHLETECNAADLTLAPEVYRSLLFTLAATRARQLAMKGARPDSDQIAKLCEPILCAFHFHLRQRDQLAAIGGISYWFRPEVKEKSIEWLRSAVSSGVQSLVARRIIAEYRRREMEQQEVMDWFRSKSVRFLRDPTLRQATREALIEELGKHQDLRPFLLDLEDTAAMSPQEPTLSLLISRSRYLEEMSKELALRDSKRDLSKINDLRGKYGQLVQHLESTAGQLNELEKSLMAEVGRSLLSSA